MTIPTEIRIEDFDGSVMTDQDGRRVLIIDPDSEFPAEAVAALVAHLIAAPAMLDALIAVRNDLDLRCGRLPYATVMLVDEALRVTGDTFERARSGR